MIDFGNENTSATHFECAQVGERSSMKWPAEHTHTVASSNDAKLGDSDDANCARLPQWCATVETMGQREREREFL